jgi:[ribosomal protein S5]-alanine N-acetyltransferase
MMIRTERLILRDFVATDWEEVLQYQNDPRYLQFSPWRERSPEAVLEFVARFLSWQVESPRSRFQLCICLAEGDKVIGNVGIRKPDPDAGVAELGFELVPEYWGNGYGTEAAARMLRFAFDELKVHRVSAHCIAENTASARVLERIGMRWEGTLRESEFFKGRWWDVRLFGALQEDWRGGSNELGR